MPDIIDVDGDTVSIEVQANNRITAIYSADTAPDIRFIIDDSMELGIYDVTLTLSDGYESTTYTIKVFIIKNTPPYFDSSEVGHIDGSMKEGSLINNFILNPIFDDQGDEISVEIEFDEIESFA